VTGAERKEEADLRDQIEKIVIEWPKYGYRRVTAVLRRQGQEVNHKRVARIMREGSLQCHVKRKFLRPKNRKTGKERYFFAKNLLSRRHVNGLNQVWVADITYIRLQQEFVYLAVILDLCSRRVIGWALSKEMTVKLTLAALRMAILDRKPKPGCIHHSDRGGQYASAQYVEFLERAGMKISMSRPGNPYDNAVMESFMKTLKSEEVEMWEYKNLEDVIGRIPYFIEKVYNEQRLHSKLGYRPPNEFEKLKKKEKPKTRIWVN
jgi:putative transposase